MSTADAIRRAIASTEQTLDELRAALAEIQGEARAVPAVDKPDKLVDTATATKITSRSSSWLYATGRKHPEIGWKVDTGSWVWSRAALRAFIAGRAAQCEESEICEVCEAPAVAKTPNQAHHSDVVAGTKI